MGGPVIRMDDRARPECALSGSPRGIGAERRTSGVTRRAGSLEGDGRARSLGCSLALSAAALSTFSRTGLGAPSTRSLASLRPRLVSARTSLMTWIFLSPAASRTTSNSSCSSTAAASPPPPRPRPGRQRRPGPPR